MVQGLCQSKPLILVRDFFYKKETKSGDKNQRLAQKSLVDIPVVELIDNTASISLGPSDGTDFISERLMN